MSEIMVKVGVAVLASIVFLVPIVVVLVLMGAKRGEEQEFKEYERYLMRKALERGTR